MHSLAPFSLLRRIAVQTDRRPGLRADRTLPRTEAGDRREADSVHSGDRDEPRQSEPMGGDAIVRLLL
jgi:hypothetical protein